MAKEKKVKKTTDILRNIKLERELNVEMEKLKKQIDQHFEVVVAIIKTNSVLAISIFMIFL